MPRKAQLPDCALCGERQGAEIDHIWPRRLGGGNETFNLWALCRECHVEKSGNYDNAHLHIAYGVRPELWEIKGNRQARAQDFESHVEGDCDLDCQYCTGIYRGEKEADDRRYEQLREDLAGETFLASCGDLIIPERAAVPLVYALYSPDADQWRTNMLRWVWLDALRLDVSRSATRLRRIMLRRWVNGLAYGLEQVESALDSLLHSAHERAPMPNVGDLDHNIRNVLVELVDLDTGQLEGLAAAKVEEGRSFYAPSYSPQQSSFLDMVPVKRVRH